MPQLGDGLHLVTLRVKTWWRVCCVAGGHQCWAHPGL